MPMKNGEPAFPGEQTASYDRRCSCGEMVRFDGIKHEGMSLRDYFAAKAMEGIVGDRSHGRHPHVAMDKETFENWAERSYAIADAMLKARDE
jgi:hypothetical protein